FVWEWIDHGLLLPGATDHVYGGDFGERLHGTNFCIDGLLFPDRTPSPGATELKKVIEPVRITGPNPLTIQNLRTFAGGDDLELVWSVAIDGLEVEAGGLELPAIAPGESVEVPPPVAGGLARSAGERLLTVRAVLAKDETWANAGHEVAWAQFALHA